MIFILFLSLIVSTAASASHEQIARRALAIASISKKVALVNLVSTIMLSGSTLSSVFSENTSDLDHIRTMARTIRWLVLLGILAAPLSSFLLTFLHAEQSALIANPLFPSTARSSAEKSDVLNLLQIIVWLFTLHHLPTMTKGPNLKITALSLLMAIISIWHHRVSSDACKCLARYS